MVYFTKVPPAPTTQDITSIQYLVRSTNVRIAKRTNNRVMINQKNTNFWFQPNSRRWSTLLWTLFKVNGGERYKILGARGAKSRVFSQKHVTLSVLTTLLLFDLGIGDTKFYLVDFQIEINYFSEFVQNLRSLDLKISLFCIRIFCILFYIYLTSHSSHSQPFSHSFPLFSFASQPAFHSPSSAYGCPLSLFSPVKATLIPKSQTLLLCSQ